MIKFDHIKIKNLEPRENVFVHGRGAINNNKELALDVHVKLKDSKLLEEILKYLILEEEYSDETGELKEIKINNLPSDIEHYNYLLTFKKIQWSLVIIFDDSQEIRLEFIPDRISKLKEVIFY